MNLGNFITQISVHVTFVIIQISEHVIRVICITEQRTNLFSVKLRVSTSRKIISTF